MIREIYNAKLGIDIDGLSELRTLIIYFNLKSVFGDVSIKRTAHGYHFVVDYPSDLDLRFIFGDDIYRIEHSIMRGGDDVLFDYKGKLVNGRIKWRKAENIDELNLLCLPFVSKIPRSYFVVARSGKNKKFKYKKCIRVDGNGEKNRK